MLCCAAAAVLGQHAVAHNESAVATLHAANQFFNRSALAPTAVDELISAADKARDDAGSTTCDHHDIQLTWTAKLGASVYSTPLIALDPAGSGMPMVLSTTFVRYVEALRGSDGHSAGPNWPHAFGRATFHTSPLLFDADGDGADELLLLSYQGELLFLKSNGVPLSRQSGISHACTHTRSEAS